MLQEEACTVELYLVKDENNHQRVLCGALLAITMRHQCSMLSPLTTRWSVGATRAPAPHALGSDDAGFSYRLGHFSHFAVQGSQLKNSRRLGHRLSPEGRHLQVHRQRRGVGRSHRDHHPTQLVQLAARRDRHVPVEREERHARVARLDSPAGQ
jgi:hypothetical protein